MIIIIICDIREDLEKREDFNCFFLLTVRPIVTCGSRVSRAAPNHTLPAFLNLHGMLYNLMFIHFN